MDVAKVFSQMFWSMQEEFQMKKKNLFSFIDLQINNDFCAKFQISNCYQTNYPSIGNYVKGKRPFTF